MLYTAVDISSLFCNDKVTQNGNDKYSIGAWNKRKKVSFKFRKVVGYQFFVASILINLIINLAINFKIYTHI